MVFNKRFSKRAFFVIIAITVIIYYPVHEIGHWLIAYIDGAEILGFYPFPSWDNGLIAPCIIVNEWTFSTIHSLIFFLVAGFLITFCPSFLLFIYLYKKESKWWIFPFTWVILSPIASMNDFFSIGRVTQNPNLGIILNLGVAITSIILTIWFTKNAKVIFRDLILVS